MSPFVAPHAMQFGPDGLLYVACDLSGVVAIVDVTARKVAGSIETGSKGSHRLVVTPNGSKIYTENEDDKPFSSVLDVKARKKVGEIPMPNGAQGIALSPEGRILVLVDGKVPEIAVVDAATDKVIKRVPLKGHTDAAQIANFSPYGHLVVTSYSAPLATMFDGGPLAEQATLINGKGPMNMAYHPDGRSVLIANHDEGTLSVVDLVERKEMRRISAGRGVETLAFF